MKTSSKKYKRKKKKNKTSDHKQILIAVLVTLLIGVYGCYLGANAEFYEVLITALTAIITSTKLLAETAK